MANLVGSVAFAGNFYETILVNADVIEEQTSTNLPTESSQKAFSWKISKFLSFLFNPRQYKILKSNKIESKSIDNISNLSEDQKTIIDVSLNKRCDKISKSY